MGDLLTTSDATLSECGQYRYALERRWNFAEFNPQVFVMLNPSTANANEDDPTIRRCIGFAKREGAGGILVVNLFAFRATDPKEMMAASNPIGPRNVEEIGLALISAKVTGRPVICAWGANQLAPPQVEILKRRARDIGAKLMCLGMTKSGAPKHPLYISKDAPLVAYI